MGHDPNDFIAGLRYSKASAAGNAGKRAVFVLAPAKALTAQERPADIKIFILYGVIHRNFRKPLDYLS